MINSKIIKLASKTEFHGLNNMFTHKSHVKNKFCGDNIKIEMVVKNNKIISMRYEAYSCVYCQASANIIAKKINKVTIKNLREDVTNLNILFNRKIAHSPKIYEHLKDLINTNNIDRINCIMLPFHAIIKALKI